MTSPAPGLAQLAYETWQRERGVPGNGTWDMLSAEAQGGWEATTRAIANAAAERCAQAILAHMDAHGPKEPGSAWRRHLSTAARVAAGAFMTREDMLAGAVEAIQRGDFVVCPSLQDHQEQP